MLTKGVKLSQQIQLLTRSKQTNEENGRSEMWHYFAYKTDDKGEQTDHRRQDIQLSIHNFFACFIGFPLKCFIQRWSDVHFF